MSYLVVQFINENSLSIVPSSWIKTSDDNKEICFWPPAHLQNKIRTHIVKATPPNVDWTPYDVKLLTEALDYNAAKKIELELSDESNIESDTTGIPSEKKRISRKRKLDCDQMDAEMDLIGSEDSDSSHKDDNHNIIYETPSKFVASLEETILEKVQSSKSKKVKNSNIVFTSPGPKRNLVQQKLVLGKSEGLINKIILNKPACSIKTSDDNNVFGSSNDTLIPSTSKKDVTLTPSSNNDTLTSTPKSYLHKRTSLKLKELGDILVEDDCTGSDMEVKDHRPTWDNKIMKGLKCLADNQNIILSAVEKSINIGISLKKSCNIIEAKYETISNQLSISTGIDESLEETLREIPALPVDSMEDFIILEGNLTTEKNYKAFVHNIHHCGGNTAEDFAKNAIERVLTNKLGSCFNMDGKPSTFGAKDAQPKKAFGSTLVCRAIIEAMQLNHRTKEEDPKKAKTKMQKWLSQAPFRKGGGGRK